MEIFEDITQYVRILPGIKKAEDASLFWIMYGFNIGFMTVLFILYGYANYCVVKKENYAVWPLHILKEMSGLFIWILFIPILESNLWMFKCESGRHKIVVSLECYKGKHIFFIILSIVYAILIIIMGLILSLFYKKYTNDPADASTSSIGYLEALMIFYRVIIVIYGTFASSVIIIISIGGSLLGSNNRNESNKYSAMCSLLLIYSML